MQRIEAPFPQAAGPHQARMEELVRKLWRDSGLEPPSRQRPLAPIARLLDECALNAHEVALLTRRLALAFLCERGVPVHEQYALPAPGPACASGEPSAAGSIGWDEPLAGFLFANEGGAALFVRAGDPIARRRFSAAHELGHYVLHFVPQATRLFARCERIQFTCAEPMPGAPSPRVVLAVARAAQPEGALETGPSSEIEAAYQAREAEADAFAAELLMPAALVSEMAAGERACWSDSDLLWRLSQQLLVSRKALWIRLSQLGWISSASPYDS